MSPKVSKILVLGCRGQLARAIDKVSMNTIYKPLFLGRQTCDISDTYSIIDYLKIHKPVFVINAAAFTNVDEAESTPKKAFEINVYAPFRISDVCLKLNIPFIHFSTDYIFDGKLSSSYNELINHSPLNQYGKSKSVSERLIDNNNRNSAIIRTAWLHSSEGVNFVSKVYSNLRRNRVIHVVDDQSGHPTSASSAAAAALLIGERLVQGDQMALGVTNFVNRGVASRYEVACFIADYMRNRGIECAEVVPVSSDRYPLPALRPERVEFDLQRSEILNLPNYDWRLGVIDSLDFHIY